MYMNHQVPSQVTWRVHPNIQPSIHALYAFIQIIICRRTGHMMYHTIHTDRYDSVTGHDGSVLSGDFKYFGRGDHRAIRALMVPEVFILIL